MGKLKITKVTFSLTSPLSLITDITCQNITTQPGSELELQSVTTQVAVTGTRGRGARQSTQTQGREGTLGAVECWDVRKQQDLSKKDLTYRQLYLSTTP